jgi:solute carrier family 50 protein (sugar transporter)
MPYIYSLLNCLICMWYGLPFVSYGVVLVATVNSIGAVFQLAYTAVFIAFADAKQRVGGQPAFFAWLSCANSSIHIDTDQ